MIGFADLHRKFHERPELAAMMERYGTKDTMCMYPYQLKVFLELEQHMEVYTCSERGQCL